jgi:hypothetical protein
MSSTKVSREKSQACEPFVKLLFHLNFGKMNKTEIMNSLSAKGITFDANASKAQLEALLSASSNTFAIEDDLLKIISEKGGKAFDSADMQAVLKADKEREYPDFGKAIPEGVYHLTGYATVVDWRNPRTDNVSHIRVAYLDAIDPKTGEPYKLPFASLAKNQYKFKPVEGDEFQPNAVLDFFDSVADRNIAVCGLEAGLEIKVCHKRGHWLNPNNKRPFDFTLTWGELVK